MNLRPVSSSRMNAVGWENNTMYIRFKNGSVYAYMNVSESQYTDFINSPSLGSALAQFDKVHPYHRV
ncbi:KTSC domain-containing protein [Clostridium sp.]|uniref:KTSC domain-containing protein n=1 Tax=Clostridium sp. TaxID=1506 RepID=UPI00284D4BC0|nr:KTSC domain-containing protein [Clostridium sp.]MDR3595150.1 KTSC domain-containing protein [Clostridium sp.]